MNRIKNNYQLALLSTIVVFIISCTLEPSRDAGKVNKDVVDEKNMPIKEDFEAFFQDFATDSMFQSLRIAYPISYYSIDIEDNQEEYVYNKNDFWYIDFTKDSEASAQIVDAYEPLIIKEDDSKILYVRKGIDNGIRIEYHFEINKLGKWHLTKIVDTSN
jgi:hypothetical protein